MQKNLPLSYLEISKSNLLHNFKVLKSVSKNTEIVAVIKGNAYGHGQNEVAKILEPHVDCFQVNSFAELKLLRKVTKKKVLVLGYIEKTDLKNAIWLGCVISIFSIEQMSKISAIAKSFDKVQEIHVPVDAFLGREGFLVKDLGELFSKIKKTKYIKLTGMYAHFANIEDTNNFSHAEKQIKKYNEALVLAKDFGFKNLQTHISATSGLLVYETRLLPKHREGEQERKSLNTFVRLGIGLYGLWPSEHIKYLYKGKLELKPVLQWKTKIAQVKKLSAGHTVGYGLTYMTYVSTKIAVIPAGYSDGYDRGLSNNGEVLIHGTKCKILGRVAMNMFVVDVTHVKNVKIEDEVVLIGKQGKAEITAEDIAKKIDTINYEVVTRLSPLLPRIIK